MVRGKWNGCWDVVVVVGMNRAKVQGKFDGDGRSDFLLAKGRNASAVQQNGSRSRSSG